MQSVLNILRVYHQASAGEIDVGLRWYLSANENAEYLAAGVRTDIGQTLLHRVDIASAVIAAVSPGLRWERNVDAAERIIAGDGLDGLGVRWYDGVRKAERILAGEQISDVLKGNKVTAFYDNIRNPLGSERVCVDGHAYAIWEGKYNTLDDTPPISDVLYDRISADYREAAELAGIRPLQIQAITWTTWRRLHGISSAHYLPLFES